MKVRSKQFLLIIFFTSTLISVVSVRGFTMNNLSKDSDGLYQQRLLPAVAFGKYRANNREIELTVFQSIQITTQEETTKLTQTINTLLVENEKFLLNFLNKPTTKTTTDEEKNSLPKL